MKFGSAIARAENVRDIIDQWFPPIMVPFQDFPSLFHAKFAAWGPRGLHALDPFTFPYNFWLHDFLHFGSYLVVVPTIVAEVSEVFSKRISSRVASGAIPVFAEFGARPDSITFHTSCTCSMVLVLK